jgi:hypothetical protein
MLFVGFTPSATTALPVVSQHQDPGSVTVLGMSSLLCLATILTIIIIFRRFCVEVYEYSEAFLFFELLPCNLEGSLHLLNSPTHISHNMVHLGPTAVAVLIVKLFFYDFESGLNRLSTFYYFGLTCLYRSKFDWLTWTGTTYLKML